MPYKLVIDLPNLAEDSELHIDLLGSFTKGGNNIISDDVARVYEGMNVGTEDAYADNEDGEKVLVGRQAVMLSFPELISRYQGLSVVKIDAEQDAPEPESSTDDTSSGTSGDVQVSDTAPQLPSLFSSDDTTEEGDKK